MIGKLLTSAGIAGAGGALHMAAGSKLYEQYAMGVHGPDIGAQKVEGVTSLTGALGIGLGVYAAARLYPGGKSKPGSAGFLGPMKPTSMSRSAGNIMKKTITGTLRGAVGTAKFFGRHPFISAGLGGGALGLGAGVAQGATRDTRWNAAEGTIRGISSSSTGGISPQLQFSTRGLVQSLHRNARRM